MEKKNRKKNANDLSIESQTLPQRLIEDRILKIRGVQVIIDKDLAALYGVPTYRLNEQVKRNIRRFPESFRFKLTPCETDELIAKCDRLNSLKHSPNPPYAFTEQGVAMLSSVLHSDEAIDISIRIMDAFVAMRHFIATNAQIFQRLGQVEQKQLETDNKIELLFDKLEERTVIPKQNIFYDGQVFDAYQFVSGLIKSAESQIVLIDNYVDESVLTILDKRAPSVTATIYTQKITPQLKLDIKKHNAQYIPIDVYPFIKAHDRFLIIDDKVYHVGASLKDLGKKWFAFSLMLDLNPEELLKRIKDF